MKWVLALGLGCVRWIKCRFVSSSLHMCRWAGKWSVELGTSFPPISFNSLLIIFAHVGLHSYCTAHSANCSWSDIQISIHHSLLLFTFFCKHLLSLTRFFFFNVSSPLQWTGCIYVKLTWCLCVRWAGFMTCQMNWVHNQMSWVRKFP